MKLPTSATTGQAGQAYDVGRIKMNRKMPEFNSKDSRVRKLWLIWSLLPVPMINPLILPSGLVFAYYAILPDFIGVHFSSETLTFPSPEQIHAYGLGFYKSLLLKSMLALVFSTVCWIASLFVVFTATRKIKIEQQEIRNEMKFFKIGIGLTTLSVLSGVLLVLAVGMIG